MQPAKPPVSGSVSAVDSDGSVMLPPTIGSKLSCTAGLPPPLGLLIAKRLLVSSQAIPTGAKGLATMLTVALRLANAAVAPSVGLEVPWPLTTTTVVARGAPLDSSNQANCAP